MWNWFNCYFSGRHDYGVWCEPGTIFLRCVHCGRRSPGWSLDTRDTPPPRQSAKASAKTRQSPSHRVPVESGAVAR